MRPLGAPLLGTGPPGTPAAAGDGACRCRGRSHRGRGCQPLNLVARGERGGGRQAQLRTNDRELPRVGPVSASCRGRRGTGRAQPPPDAIGARRGWLLGLVATQRACSAGGSQPPARPAGLAPTGAWPPGLGRQDERHTTRRDVTREEESGLGGVEGKKRKKEKKRKARGTVVI